MKQRTRDLAIFYTALFMSVAAIAVAIVIQFTALGWKNWTGAAIVGVCLAGLVWRVHADPDSHEKLLQKRG